VRRIVVVRVGDPTDGGSPAAEEEPRHMRSPTARRRSARAFLTIAATAGLAAATAASAGATSWVDDAHGVRWDVNDAANIATDDGSVLSGGDYNPFGSQTTASPFDGYGALRATVTAGSRSTGGGHILRGFGLKFDGTAGWTTRRKVVLDGVRVTRTIHVDAAGGWLRYADTFTNTARSTRKLRVAFGGSLGYTGYGYPRLMSAQADGAPVVRYVAATSSGDTTLSTADGWAALADSPDGTPGAPTSHGPAGVLFSAGAAPGLPTGFSDFEFARGAFTTPYDSAGGRGRDFLGVDYDLAVRPGRSATLVHVLTAGTAETAATAGTQVAAVTARLAALAAAPPLAGLTPLQACTLRNFAPSRTGVAAATCAALRPAATRRVPAATTPTTTSPYPVADKTVSQMVADLAKGRTTSVAITQAYLDRIKAFDGLLNAYLYVDAKHALAQARAADRKRARGGKGLLLGVPIALKDLYDTKDMPTTAGSLALAGSRPTADATSVARLRKAGAVIIGKLNLSEFAWSGSYSQSGVGGSTWNPYDTDRSPAGSSGGSGAATAASLAGFTMGSDSCGSLQGVSGVNGVDTYRATRGLTSLTGVYPLEGFQDSAGPITRSVRDLATSLDVLAGTDPADPLTKGADKHIPAAGYTSFLKKGALEGARLGYLDYFPGQFGDPAQQRHFDAVLARLRAAGATVVDVTDAFDTATAAAAKAYSDSGVWGYADYRYDVDKFLAETPGYTKKDLAGIAASHKAIWWVQDFLDQAAATPPSSPAQRAATAAAKRALNAAISGFMASQHLTALTYPTQSDDPPLADGVRGFNQNCQISADSGLPGVVVAAGLDSHRLPVGLEFLGPNWSDGKLLGLAYAFEQSAAGTKVGRVAPAGFGDLAVRR
jgi:amidase